MPIYEYRCLDCGREFEELVRDRKKPPCPACGRRRLERRMSVSAGHVIARGRFCPARANCGMSHCHGPDCGLVH